MGAIMDENTSLRKLNLSCLLESIVHEGFSNGQYKSFFDILGQRPTRKEVNSPIHVLTREDLRGEVDTALYAKVGEKMDQDMDFYQKQCPAWLHYETAETSLKKAVDASLGRLTVEREYVHGVKIGSTSPKCYNRLESTAQKRLPESKRGEQMYVSSIDIDKMDYKTAAELFKELYVLIPEKNLEVHNNKLGVHEQINHLEEALELSWEADAIVKADQPVTSKYNPKVNLYLKPNDSYHVKLDMLGTREEILAFTGKVDQKLKEFYSQQKMEHLQ